MSSPQLLETIRRLEARVNQLEKVLSVVSGDVVIKVGESSIRLNRVSIAITSGDITLKGSGRIRVESSGEVTLKGSRISQN
jgi:hypothetical protein